MRCIFVGIEYAGKSTLVERMQAYYRRFKRTVHEDDHFTIPDATLSPESRALMVKLPDDMKERFQRMQIHYHIEVLRNYPNVAISGWHIEEAIYSASYGDDPDNPYYKNYAYSFQRHYEVHVLEARLPDIVLVHVTASDDAIRQRMKTDPHGYPIIKEEDIPEIKRRFEEEIEKSLFHTQLGGSRTIVLDTTDRTPQESFDELLLRSEPLITAGELAMRCIPVPEGDYEVRYENGVRKMIATSG